MSNGSYSIHISGRKHSIKNKKNLVSFYNHILRVYQEKKGTYDKDKIVELIENPCKSANKVVEIKKKEIENNQKMAVFFKKTAIIYLLD